MYCCTQGLGHINKCPVSFIYHNLFPFKELGRGGALCQPYLQPKRRSMLPFGGLRQWDLQALFSFLVSLWVSGTCVCFVLPSPLLFFFSLSLFCCSSCLRGQARLILGRIKSSKTEAVAFTRLILPPPPTPNFPL